MKEIPNSVLILFVAVSFSVASFGIGYLAGSVAEMGEGSLIVESSSTIATAADFAVGGQVVASKNGTQYYFPWCGAVHRIKKVNQIWFSQASSARRAGYTPAIHCKGVRK